MSSTTGSPGSSSTTHYYPSPINTMPTPWQDKLHDHCEQWRMMRPVWHLISDRRGGRTAWSSTVCIEGQLQHVPARYWYDGQYINNAKEDAAEVALQRLHVIASPTSPTHARVCTAGNIYRPN